MSGARAGLLAHAPLLQAAARRLARRLPPHVDVRDLVQAAWLRLLRRPAGADAGCRLTARELTHAHPDRPDA